MSNQTCTRCGREIDPIREIIDSTVSQNGISYYQPKPVHLFPHCHKCAVAKAIEDERRWQAFLMRSMLSDAELRWGNEWPETRKIIENYEKQPVEPEGGKR